MGGGVAWGDADLMPLDQVHQFAYCPRRMHLMYVGGEWSDNTFTVEGRYHHMRVDGEEDPLPDPREDPESPKCSRSVQLSSPGLGIIAKADLIETHGTIAEPVEYKRGETPDNPTLRTGAAFARARVYRGSRLALLRRQPPTH